MSKSFFCLVVLGLWAARPATAQGIAARVAAEANNPARRTSAPFRSATFHVPASRILPDASFFTLDRAVISALLHAAPPVLELIVPTRQGEVHLKLVAARPLTDEFQVIAASTGRAVQAFAGLHYVGIVNDDPHTLAAISIFRDQVMGFVNDGHGDHVLGPMEHSDAHVYYATKDLPPLAFSCTTPEDAMPYTHEQLEPHAGDRSVHCVRFYWEVNNDIYINKGSMANTVNYATALFNQSAALFANDGISVTLNQLYVWDVASPYVGTTMYDQLTFFQNTRNVFNGDLATLLGYSGGGGRAASLAGLCNGNNDNSMCYAGIASSFSNIPTYSWSVLVVSHEEGHLLGSNHTHACVWNGNGTQIDGCGPTAGYSEGSCPIGPIPPSGGTIMSYCHLNPVGINFLNGFGPQPLAVITNSLAIAPCVINCTAVGCGPVFGTSVSNITTTTAQLNWLPAAAANSYKLQWKPLASPTWTTVPAVVGTTYALSGLSPWTSYAFQLKTNCASDTSAYCAPTGFTTAANSLSDGLVACYPFNGSPNDQSGNGHNGVLLGPVPTADRFGVPNAAYFFNGSSDRIEVADLNTFPISNEISIGFWIRTLESKGNALIWAFPDIGADRLLVTPNFLHTALNDFSWDFGDHFGPGNCFLTDYAFHVEWQHYVVTSSALSNSMKVYLNGALIDEEHHSSFITNLNRTLDIGGNGAAVFYFHGAMDDLTIHNRELTAGEVMQLYTSGTPCAQRITVAPKAFLDGPYDQTAQLMSDALRSAGLIPGTEPYSALGYSFVAGGATTQIPFGVLTVIGHNAITDWVVVELRQAVAPYSVIATRTALVQRDGDVVGMDGVSPVAFDATPGNYRIAIRHRNHLGVMTGSSYALSSAAPAVIDFTSTTTLTYGTAAQKQVGTRMVMWAGNTNSDATLKYTGVTNDRDPILVRVGGAVPNNTVAGYFLEDASLDGVVKYTGANNDRDPILVNIGGVVPTNTRQEQLP